MSGIFRTIANIFQKGANDFREEALSEKEVQHRENIKQVLEMVKVASIVSFVAAAYIFSLFPTFFNGFLLALAGFASREIYKVAENLLEIFRAATTELRARATKEGFLTQITKGTYLINPIVRLIDPTFKDVFN